MVNTETKKSGDIKWDSLGEEELTSIAKVETNTFPDNWEEFPVEAKRVAVRNLLNGRYTREGFLVLKPDFLETLSDTLASEGKPELASEGKPEEEIQFN